MGEKEPTAGEFDREIKEAREEAEAAMKETVARVGSELGLELKLEDTPESLTVTITDKEGKERPMGFMKMRGMEGIIEARLRFPDDTIDEALRKTEKLKRKEKRP